MKGKGLYIKNLSGQTIKDLVDEKKKLNGELFSLKMKHSSKGLKETHELRDLKKKISRLNTFLTSKIKASNGNNR